MHETFTRRISFTPQSGDFMSPMWVSIETHDWHFTSDIYLITYFLLDKSSVLLYIITVLMGTTQNEAGHFYIMLYYNVWCVFNGYCSLSTSCILELFMYLAHDFHVNGENQARYLSAMSVSRGNTQNEAGHYSTMV